MTISTSLAKGQDAAENPFPFGNLRPFKTDGCTKFPNGTIANPNLWLHCCVLHDLKYWAGGQSEEKLSADLELYRCVKATGSKVIANAMYYGVRAGGSAYYPTQWRWGFGWERARWYAPLNEFELQRVRELTPEDPMQVPLEATPQKSPGSPTTPPETLDDVQVDSFEGAILSEPF